MLKYEESALLQPANLCSPAIRAASKRWPPLVGPGHKQGGLCSVHGFSQDEATRQRRGHLGDPPGAHRPLAHPHPATGWTRQVVSNPAVERRPPTKIGGPHPLCGFRCNKNSKRKSIRNCFKSAPNPPTNLCPNLMPTQSLVVLCRTTFGDTISIFGQK